MEFFSFMPLTLGTTLTLMALLWLLSLKLRDASIVDLFWGAGFVIIAWLAFALSSGTIERKLLVAMLATVWGLRLAIHLSVRNLGHGEDPRYQAMRRQHGSSFWWVSFFTVFMLQGVLMWIVSLPVQVVSLSDAPLFILDGAALALWLVGFLFEALGDAQLARFKRDPANAGKVMDRGLWRYTRHPNYFGDFLVWWAYFLFALAAGWSYAWTAIGPLLMSVLLMRVSGVTLLEKRLRHTRPQYAEYVRRTSAFFPRPPKR